MPDLRDPQREQDGTEIRSRELEPVTGRAHNLTAQRDSFETMRDAAAELRRTARKPKEKKPGPGRPRTASAAEVEAAARAWNEGFGLERGRRRPPEAMVRHESDARRGMLNTLGMRGHSLEPVFREGDTARARRTLRAPERRRPRPQARRARTATVPAFCALASHYGFTVPRALPEMTIAGFVVLTGDPAGFHPSKRQPLPGTQTLWEGVKFLSQAVLGILAMLEWNRRKPKGEDPELRVID